jgi:hypothetical protein
MVTLEQIRQLETKIGKAIDYVNRVNGENVRLRGEIDGSEKRIAELEAAVLRFREEESRIEEGILAALDKLDQFEDAVNKGFSTVQAVVAAAAPAAVDAVPPAVDSAPPPSGDTPQGLALTGEEEPEEEDLPEETEEDPSEGESGDGSAPDSEETGSDELDIF